MSAPPLRDLVACFFKRAGLAFALPSPQIMLALWAACPRFGVVGLIASSG